MEAGGFEPSPGRFCKSLSDRCLRFRYFLYHDLNCLRIYHCLSEFSPQMLPYYSREMSPASTLNIALPEEYILVMAEKAGVKIRVTVILLMCFNLSNHMVQM